MHLFSWYECFDWRLSPHLKIKQKTKIKTNETFVLADDFQERKRKESGR